MEIVARKDLRQLITYRGESEKCEWALWIGDEFIAQLNGDVHRMQHPEDNLGLPIFSPYKDPV